MNVVLYSTGCPKCKILKSKLDSKNIKYETISDVDLMQEKGFMSLPMLEVDNNLMEFVDAVHWVSEV